MMAQQKTTKMHDCSILTILFVYAVYIKTINGFVLRLPCEKAANFSIVKQDAVLQGSVIATFMFTEISECQYHCMFKDGCQSINYEMHGENICELNNITTEDVRYDVDLTDRKGWIYMSTDHRYHLVGHNCQQDNPCPSGVLCTDTCEVPGYKCHICAPDQFGFDCQPAWKDCQDVMNAGHTNDGVYLINPTLERGRQFHVFCNFNVPKRRGWIVIQRRVDRLVDFNRNWTEYEKGFGFFQGSFWLGLSKMHALTSERGIYARLRITIKSKQSGIRSGFAQYSEFAVGSSSNKYTLYVAKYNTNSTLGDSLGDSSSRDLNGMKFTTFDQDNDTHNYENCASIYGGGWWFSNCFSAFLNGLFPPEDHIVICSDYSTKYMTWFSFNQCYGDVTFSEMKIRIV